MISGPTKIGRFTLPSWFIPAFGYVLSLGCLIWVFHGIDFDTILEDFESLHWGWVALAVVSDIFVYVWQGWRWNLLLRPVVNPPLFRSVRAIYVGLFANEVLPLRTGELLRCFLQARWSEIPFSVAVASAMIERLFDGIWLTAAFFGTTLFVSLPRFLVDGGRVMAVVVAVLSLIMGLVIFWKHHAHAAVKKTRWSERLKVLVDDLHAMGGSRSFYYAALASLPYLLIQVIPIFALMKAYGLDLSLAPATVVLIILRIGTVIPQAPGNVGSFQALIVLSMGLFGVEKTTAAGFSLMMWGVITLPLLVAGFIAVAVTGMKFEELKEHARNLQLAPATVATESQSQ